MRVGQGHPRVAALPDQPDAHLGGVDAHRVVGLVADSEMGFVDLLTYVPFHSKSTGHTGWRGSAALPEMECREGRGRSG
jgi:hypothetical protein